MLHTSHRLGRDHGPVECRELSLRLIPVLALLLLPNRRLRPLGDRWLAVPPYKIKHGLVDGESHPHVNRVEDQLHLTRTDCLTHDILNGWMALTNEWHSLLRPMIGGQAALAD